MRRGGSYLFLHGFEKDYELPSTDPETFQQWHTLRVYRERPSGAFEYYAKLNADFDLVDWAASENGRRVAAVSTDNNFSFDLAKRLYVFEIPDDATFPGTQQDTFETGNFARWTSTAGQFAVASTSASRVLRQSSLVGDAGAHLTAIDWTDQSIEADIRPLEFAGTNRWFGLVTRRLDASNYYYVTFRSPDLISLRRLRNGVFTELAATRAPSPFTPGRSYRVRLESVGDQHAVFLEGIPRLHAKDTTIAQGSPVVAGYRTRFDVDNVIVSGATRLALRLDTSKGNGADRQAAPSSSSRPTVDRPAPERQHRQCAGFPRSRPGTRSSTRVRPMSYGATGT